MRGVVLHAPGDVRVVERENPKILFATDAIIRVSAACICGSDLWPFRGVDEVHEDPVGHEYVGVVEQVAAAVKTLEVGEFVVGSFFASDNTCEICRAGYQSRCVHAEPMNPIGAQAQLARVPLADGTLDGRIIDRPGDTGAQRCVNGRGGPRRTGVGDPLRTRAGLGSPHAVPAGR
jgi:threonine dehydrogenase-like Zn-dependent dehydrogenase